MNENTPIWQLTVAELRKIIREEIGVKEPEKPEKRFVYGNAGIAEIFNCSPATAQRIKSSGKIKKAISQVGRKIVVDADMALELYKRK